MNTLENNEIRQDIKNLASLVYFLQALGLLTGITFIAGLIVNYLKRDEVKGTIVESHFRWQIRTFWFASLWAVLGIVLALVLIGYLILLADTVWVIYRIVKGWLTLNSGRAMYVISKGTVAS